LISTWLKDSTGTWFGGSQRNPVVIGETLARKLKVKINSKIVLTFQNAEGNLTGGSYRVCGIYRIDNNAFEETQFMSETRPGRARRPFTR
jgi:putative ABC transport system permease protein